MAIPMSEKLKWPGIEYLSNELYVERYLMPVKGVDTLVISTRHDVYWPMGAAPMTPTTHVGDEPNDGFMLDTIWYQSMRQVLRVQGGHDEMEVEIFILNLTFSLLTLGVNLNRQTH